MSNYRLINQLLTRVEIFETEPFEIAADMHSILRRYPKMSLSKLSNVLAAQFTFRSARFYKTIYNIYMHFCVKSGISVTDLAGIDFRLLRTIAEGKKKIFDVRTTKYLIKSLKNDCATRQEAWELLKSTKSRRILEIIDEE